jgi:hypothetical protein
MGTTRRRTRALVPALLCAVLVGACSDGGDQQSAASSSPAGGSASGSPSESADPGTGDGDLAGGLLPDDAFEAGATVIPLSRGQLEQGAGLAADPETTTITPEDCAAAVEGTQPQIEDFDDVAAVSATSGASTTVEVLLQGEATAGAVETLSDAAANCPEAQIASPEFGEATVTFEPLDVPALGDGAVAVRYTTTLTQDGQQIDVPALVGLVQDDDRVITLLTIATDGSQPDAAVFTSLLEQAFEVQAEVLG